MKMNAQAGLGNCRSELRLYIIAHSSVLTCSPAKIESDPAYFFPFLFWCTRAFLASMTCLSASIH